MINFLFQLLILLFTLSFVQLKWIHYITKYTIIHLLRKTSLSCAFTITAISVMAATAATAAALTTPPHWPRPFTVRPAYLSSTYLRPSTSTIPGYKSNASALRKYSTTPPSSLRPSPRHDPRWPRFNFR